MQEGLQQPGWFPVRGTWSSHVIQTLKSGSVAQVEVECTIDVDHDRLIERVLRQGSRSSLVVSGGAEIISHDERADRRMGTAYALRSMCRPLPDETLG